MKDIYDFLVKYTNPTEPSENFLQISIMVCTNCARIWQETGVYPDHYNRGNISTCPEPHHRNCYCVSCSRRPVELQRQPPVPAPAHRPEPEVRSSKTRQIYRFVSPTSSSPRCTELISECPICLVDFDESVASVNTSCGHKICLGCFTTMLVSNLRISFIKKTICPLCRTTVIEKAE